MEIVHKHTFIFINEIVLQIFDKYIMEAVRSFEITLEIGWNKQGLHVQITEMNCYTV
jgi:hypothetical protein